jgi:Cft2 family RNA processing exonuclease
MKFDFPIFFDSPMGSKATEIYQKYMGLMSGEIQKQIFKVMILLFFPDELCQFTR